MTSARCAHGDPGFEERYRAIEARDARFDGQFFTAVASTGIYCRPSCPARTPKRANVSFYRTSAGAHLAGYRACKRCLPEATPGTPDWNLRHDLIGRAMRLIGDGVVDRGGVEGLAGELGYTPRHLHRLLVDELGAGPLALARARRAQTARTLLVDTDLRLADVAFAAGFGSVRQFNDTIAEVFGARPGELRARARGGRVGGGAARDIAARGAGVGGAAGGLPARSTAAGGDTAADGAGGAGGAGVGAPIRLSLALPVREPFDAPGVFAFLTARAVPGVEAADLGADHLRYARTLGLPSGPGAARITATRRGGTRHPGAGRPGAGGSGTGCPGTRREGWDLRLDLELTTLHDVSAAVSRIRRLFDLDADPLAIDTALARDPALAGRVAATPGIRVPGAVDPHELLIRAIVGQQISVAAARTHLTRLAAALGTPLTSAFAGLERVFPTAAQIAAGLAVPAVGAAPDPDRLLRLPGRSIAAVAHAARDLANGALRVDVGVDGADLRRDLVARVSIGPWTAAYVAMRVLGDPDAWLPGDVALLAGARSAGLLPPEPPMTKAAAHRALTDRAAEWAPWRSYAVMHLWREGTP